MHLHYDLEGQGHILFFMVDYVEMNVRINLLLPTVCEISQFKCIHTMTRKTKLLCSTHIGVLYSCDDHIATITGLIHFNSIS